MNMLNTIKNLLEGNNKKVKTVEAAKREVDKLTATENELQSQRSSVAGKINEVENALRIIAANLVIDDKDKAALASKEKGTKKLENMRAELNELDTKIVETQQKALEAKKDLFRSQGDQARKNSVEVVKQQSVIGNLIGFFKAENIYGSLMFGHVNKPTTDLSEAYGLGDFQQVNPGEQRFVIEANKEDMAKGKEEARAITKEAIEAVQAVLAKHGIELTDETVKRIEHL
ncbi:hypothetical protein [Bacillus pseudomycoides]|uniref:hypothetical protein n=1 Tax=Bacillus pseudomycoides TaxID=64104 RepID=UPI001FB2B53B|nr:hypothetical protein [Bacillus pseudomycoides]